MVDFHIVEYDHTYAAALADMWNRSGDSWGGYNVDFTAESVRQQEESTGAEARYLALVGQEVVGYVNLLQWTKGEGGLYVGVLNVRPDYHGKKIGKALLLRTIARTTELGWPRIDLHTWGGNTKAVPLYKRTGFFWEERDQEVYCVNFMPGVLRNELVSDFFETADWYRDSTRSVEIKPDGRKENEFTYFTYSWEKDGRFLTMEFARKGRGLATIDRNEFRLSARVCDLNLVFGKSYTVRYELENRTDKPMTIEIRGRNDKNVRFDFHDTATVSDSYAVEAEYFVGEIDSLQSEWKTHPRVAADITINGKTAPFEVGIAPQFPARLALVPSRVQAAVGRPMPVYLDIESKLAEPALITVNAPVSQVGSFGCGVVARRLESKARASEELSFTPARCGVFGGRLQATARLEGGEEIAFTTEIGMRIPLLAGTYHGEMPRGSGERIYTIGNGPFSVSLCVERDSHRNVARLSHDRGRRGSIMFFPPKLGKPYTEEFMERRPDAISVEEETGTITLVAAFESRDIAGVTVRMRLRLYPTGVVERWFDVENTGGVAIDRELAIMDLFRCGISQVTLPYDGRILESESELDASIWRWDGEKISENWLFSRYANGTVGFTWSPEVKLQSQEWLLAIEHSIPELRPGATFITPPVTGFVDTFASWRELREYATGRTGPPPNAQPIIALDVNDGNPFVDGEFSAVVRERRQKHLDGAIELTSQRSRFDPSRVRTAKDEKRKSIRFQVAVPEVEDGRTDRRLDVATARLEGPVVRTNRSAAYFLKSDEPVKTHETQANGFAVFSAAAGSLEIRVAPEFSPGLYSCTYDGVSWLDGTFPERGPRDWWNPWLGGAFFGPANLGEQALVKQTSTARFVDRADTFGNRWSGICVTTTFTEHVELCGLAYDQYFLILAETPLVLIQSEVHQNTGTHFEERRFRTQLFVGGEPTTDTAFSFRNTAGRRVEIGSGHEEKNDTPTGLVAVRRAGVDLRMLVYAGCDRFRMHSVTNKRTSLVAVGEPLTARDGASVWTSPKFLVFSDFDIEEESLRVLRDVRVG